MEREAVGPGPGYLRPMRRMGGLEWTLLLALAALWGGSYFFGKVAVSELPPATAMLGRIGFAALALLACCAALGAAPPRDPRSWLCFAVMGALNNVAPMSLIL
jgi:drug/metabolite transporter (DMT)-like permease